MPRWAACMAIAVAEQAAIEARSNHPGLGPDPSPPIAAGMSVTAFSPDGPMISHCNPSRQTAEAQGFGFKPADGRCRKRS
jgi:hypothetical protein